MVERIFPTFQAVKDWAASKTALSDHEGAGNPHSGSFASADYDPEADTHSRYTDSEASSAAPVQSVDGQTGDVNITFYGSTAPSSPGSGTVWYDTSNSWGTDQYVYNGTSWNFVRFIPDRPDSEILDDFADNKLTNRDSKSQTSPERGYKGQTLSFRPSYTTQLNGANGTFDAQGSQMYIYHSGGDNTRPRIRTDKTFNPTEYNNYILSIEYQNIEISDNRTSGGGHNKIGFGAIDQFDENYLILNNGSYSDQNGFGLGFDANEGNDHFFTIENGSINKDDSFEFDTNVTHNIRFEIDRINTPDTVDLYIDEKQTSSLTGVASSNYYLSYQTFLNASVTSSEWAYYDGVKVEWKTP